jgi:hypothetical protein
MKSEIGSGYGLLISIPISVAIISVNVEWDKKFAVVL